MKSVMIVSLWAVTLVPGIVSAQSATSPPIRGVAGDASGAVPALPAFDGPPPPVLPATIARDAKGRATMRAVRVDAPLRIDGNLNEAVFGELVPMTDFIQTEPKEGAPATVRTEVWILFDDSHVYVAARCWEPDMDRVIANEMRRDAANLFSSNDAFSFMFDTFYDRRSAIALTANPVGGRTDGQSSNERVFNLDYNPVWEVKAGRFEGGWTVEAAVPFKSLRYRPGREQVWGFNARRHNPWRNETSFLMPTSAARGPFGIVQASIAGTVIGLEAPEASRLLELKPFATSSLTTDLLSVPRLTNDPDADVGIDVKYGLTQNLTADLTINTDFAQVEADEQQVNLTRFSLFFPEKREFFLESKGTFDFGGTATSDTPLLFYSRRIGLQQGRAVPILAGGRLTGRVGRYSIGLLNIQTNDEPSAAARATNFAVARLKRDILSKSSIGVMATRRSLREIGAGSNEAFGVDGLFAFFKDLQINTYWARTRTAGVSRDDTSYRAQFDYAGDRYGLQLEEMAVGDNFNPEVGFVRRDDQKKRYAQARFSPRPARSRTIRKLGWIATATHIEDGDGRLETRDVRGEFEIDFHNSDRFEAWINDTYELLPQPFRISPGVTLPTGGYDFTFGHAGYTFGQRRKVSGTVSIERGTFYNGHRTTLAVTGGRVELTPRFSLQPTVSSNWVDLVQGAFTSRVVGTRVTFTVTPLMFVSGLVQYNSTGNLMASNVRFRWEYAPGSELFVVYNDQRNTLTPGFPDVLNRAVIVKINRLFRP